MKRAIIFLLCGTFAFAVGISGTYSTKQGSIKVQNSEQGMLFEILTIGNNSRPAVCDLKGIAASKNQSVIAFRTQSDEGICTVVFDFSSPSKLRIRSTKCGQFCSDRSSFDGEYPKTAW